VNHVQSNDFLENVIKEKKELEESMKESFRQRDERKKKEQTESEKMQEELEPLPLCPMADD
jgi:hypothetical protein